MLCITSAAPRASCKSQSTHSVGHSGAYSRGRSPAPRRAQAAVCNLQIQKTTRDKLLCCRTPALRRAQMSKKKKSEKISRELHVRADRAQMQMLPGLHC